MLFSSIYGCSIYSKEHFDKEITEEIYKTCIFKPDILIEESKEDYVNGIDSILNYALNYTRSKKI